MSICNGGGPLGVGLVVSACADEDHTRFSGDERACSGCTLVSLGQRVLEPGYLP